MTRGRSVAFALALTAPMLLVTSCRIDAAKSRVFLTRDGRVVLQPAPNRKGETILTIENDDDVKHRVVLVKLSAGESPSGLPISARGVLPVGGAGDLEFHGAGYQVVEKLDTMRPYYGGDKRITAVVHTYLGPGRYVLLSNLPGDYQHGVWATFAVGGAT